MPVIQYGKQDKLGESDAAKPRRRSAPMAPPARLAAGRGLAGLIRCAEPYLIGEFGSRRMSRYLSTLPINSGISFWKKWLAPGIVS